MAQIESISTQTSDLQYTVQKSESAFRESFSELNLDFNRSQRSLEKMDDEMSRIFDSDKESRPRYDRATRTSHSPGIPGGFRRPVYFPDKEVF